MYIFVNTFHHFDQGADRQYADVIDDAIHAQRACKACAIMSALCAMTNMIKHTSAHINASHQRAGTCASPRRPSNILQSIWSCL